MATTRIIPLHVGKGRTESRAIGDIIDYAANPQKTDGGRLITGYACDSRTADAEFLLAKRQYIAATGRVRGADDVIAYQVRQSFKPGEITPEEANRLGVEFAKRFTKGNHPFVVCTHIDRSHVHNHIIWSAVNLACDRKFRNFWGSTRAVRRLNDTICIENGLSIVADPEFRGKSYNQWLGDKAKPSHREQLRVMIDRALEQKPADLDGLLKLLAGMGCEVSRRGKAIRLKAPGWDKAARLDSLEEGYTLDDLQAVLAGRKAHTSRKKICHTDSAAQGQSAGGHPGEIAGRERRWLCPLGQGVQPQADGADGEFPHRAWPAGLWGAGGKSGGGNHPPQRAVGADQGGGEAHGGDRRPADPHRQLRQDPRGQCGLPESRLLQEIPGGT